MRKINSSLGVDAAPGEAGPSAQDAEASAPASASRSDPLCCVCGKEVAYDMPLRGLRGCLAGPGKLDMADMLTPSGRVMANSALKSRVQCEDCSPKGALCLTVCPSGGSGQRYSCSWCFAHMSAQATEAATLWCGKRHNNCRALVIENEDGLQDNLAFLQRGLVAPLQDTTPFDEVRLVSQGFNSCYFALVATSSLTKQLVLLEIDGRQHAGGRQYSAQAEQTKNTENFAVGRGHDNPDATRVPVGQVPAAKRRGGRHGQEGKVGYHARLGRSLLEGALRDLGV